MSYGIRLLVWGDFACFSRVDMKVERVSYDVPTVSACKGILDSIYWHPGIEWIVDKIHVLKPIRYFNIRRNERKEKLSVASVYRAMRGEEEDLSLYGGTDSINQRSAMVLRDVAYGIEAHFEMTPKAPPEDTPEKHLSIMVRRLKKGQCFNQPVLGCREFTAYFAYAEEFPESMYRGTVKDLGYMLYRMEPQGDGTLRPSFYRPQMVDGVIDVAKYGGEAKC